MYYVLHRNRMFLYIFCCTIIISLFLDNFYFMIIYGYLYVILLFLFYNFQWAQPVYILKYYVEYFVYKFLINEGKPFMNYSLFRCLVAAM